MARTHYTFTFTHAQPGSAVTFSAPVYADGTVGTPDGPRLVLDSSNTVSVWTDAATLTAQTIDANGLPISATATRASSTVSVADGTAGTALLRGSTATFSGTGAQVAFVIPHGLTGTPTKLAVTAASADAAAAFYASADGTNITVTYAAAPASGTGNVVLDWTAAL